MRVTRCLVRSDGILGSESLTFCESLTPEAASESALETTQVGTWP